MRILELTLVGYTRLLLSGINVIHYTPEQDCQLILGTNGSGKSSLMREMSLLPANPSYFTKGGSKRVKAEHAGSIYEVSSTFSPKAEHRFYKDGESLNPGGTITVQRELIKKYTGLDEELFSLLIGSTLFTAMPSLKRRDWIMRLSGNDLTYAMRVFTLLKNKLRDATGVVKHYAKRLGEEADKLPSVDEITQMQTICENTKELLTVLMLNKERGLESKKSISERIKQQTAELERLCKQIIKLEVPTRATVAELDGAISETKFSISELRAGLDAYHKEYSKYDELIKAMERTDNCGIEELGLKLKDIRTYLDELKHSLPENMEDFNGYYKHRSIEAAVPAILEIMNEIPDNPDNKYSVPNLEKLKNSIQESKSTVDKLAVELAKALHALEHSTNADDTNCPKCGFRLKTGLRHSTPEVITEVIKELEAKANAAETIYSSQLETLANGNIYQGYMRRISTTINAHNAIESLWTGFRKVWIEGGSKLAAIYITKWIDYSRSVEEYVRKGKEYEELEYAYNALKANNMGSVKKVADSVKEIEDLIVHTGRAIKDKQTELTLLESERKILVGLNTNVAEVNRLYASLKTELGSFAKAIRDESINALISDNQSTLASTEAVFNKAKRATHLMEEIRISKEKAEYEHRALSLLIQELSPTEGLIADQVNAFMSCFVDSINSIIASIWTYDLKMMACGLDGAELDYKFPMLVGLSEKPTPDVSEGSTSQVDIVNFAFKLVTISFLELDNYPLYLDELAPSLDEQHRLNIIMFVKQFLEMRKASQLFMISHYAVMHGSFSQTDITVLDANNIITLPPKYNTHVKFE